MLLSCTHNWTFIVNLVYYKRKNFILLRYREQSFIPFIRVKEGTTSGVTLKWPHRLFLFRASTFNWNSFPFIERDSDFREAREKNKSGEQRILINS